MGYDERNKAARKHLSSVIKNLFKGTKPKMQKLIDQTEMLLQVEINLEFNLQITFFLCGSLN